MKAFSVFFFALFASSASALTHRPTFDALQVRGGANLGPLDSDTAMKLAKTATTAYIAGSASKYIAKQTGGNSPQLAEFVTGDLFALNALVTAVAAAMYGLGSSGFEAMETLAAGYALALLLCCDKNGFSVDTVKNNVPQTVITVILLVLAFVK
ncbi:hypothetical protein IV203_027468 [Nitzschia inconspicua]|uniref:Uncharacterized protein n=1 Tax=Nitzschia inconspicua TaxID=303405 RepID=A0A9K3LWS0_9STRA|nr:hypothetical protein IV203_027468 [Nitzschia inconspicua]